MEERKLAYMSIQKGRYNCWCLHGNVLEKIIKSASCFTECLLRMIFKVEERKQEEGDSGIMTSAIVVVVVWSSSAFKTHVQVEERRKKALGFFFF